MRKLLLIMASICLYVSARAYTTDTSLLTPFERSHGAQTATYDEAISFYKKLYSKYHTVLMGDMGISDIGYPMYMVYYSKDQQFNTGDWQAGGKVVILINNDIHPGEPDGVDACMMLLRDAATGKIDVPANVVLAIVPVYNIGGAVNRNSTTRVNQNGPESYGFRGNSRNLDLNRDFIKCDAAETISLEGQFAKINPDLFIDNHVSDGADYQHIMTLIATQHDKLGGETGDYMYNTFTPLIYKDMKMRGYDLVPYVNDFDKTPSLGWREFIESPRFSSGYAALFGIMAYVPETHMLKPFKERVKATYALMRSFIKEASAHAPDIKRVRAADRLAIASQKQFPLDWKIDTMYCDSVLFMGYEPGYKPSDVSGLPRLYYDHNKPFTKKVPFYDHYTPALAVTAPQGYIIPKSWTPVVSILRNSGVHITRLDADTEMLVTAYHIDNYETVSKPYEKHYLHKNIQATSMKEIIHFSQGDYIIWLNQAANRYIAETLEPTAPDGFFAWNFFDGVLQEKEYFSDYVFEDVAAKVLAKDPQLKELLDDRRRQDTVFAHSADAQLDFVYRHSKYLEPGYMRYPVSRIEW